jgi:hypothetical protein
MIPDTRYGITWRKDLGGWVIEDLDGPVCDRHGRIIIFGGADMTGWALAAAARDRLDRGLPPRAPSPTAG